MRFAVLTFLTATVLTASTAEAAMEKHWPTGDKTMQDYLNEGYELKAFGTAGFSANYFFLQKDNHLVRCFEAAQRGEVSEFFCAEFVP